jgi:hypothetical protein
MLARVLNPAFSQHHNIRGQTITQSAGIAEE